MKTMAMDNTKALRKTIIDNYWYRQAGSIPMFHWITACIGVACEMDLPLTVFTTDIKLNAEGFYLGKELTRQARAYLKQYKKTPSCINAYIQRMREYISKIESITFGEAAKISRLNYVEVQKFTQKFDSLLLQFWRNAFLPDKFDPEGNIILNEEISSHKKKIPQAVIGLLTHPAQKNYVKEEQLAWFKLLEYCARNPSEKEKSIKKYAHHYFWIENSWEQTKMCDVAYFAKRYDTATKHYTLKGIQREITQLKNYELTVARKHTFYQRKYHIPPSIMNIFYFFAELNYIRDLRKYAVLLHNHVYALIIQRLAQLWGVPTEDLYFLTPQDVLRIRSYTEINDELQRRKECVLWIVKNKKYTLYSGKEARDIRDIFHETFRKQHRELKGHVACQGSVEGTVCIVLGEKDFGTFKEGQILVACMTRPEYLPLMKKAAAIVTDEGGITCHAAIVSRELNKPCIVGTHQATQVLKNGMKILVDAQKGYIFVIS